MKPDYTADSSDNQPTDEFFAISEQYCITFWAPSIMLTASLEPQVASVESEQLVRKSSLVISCIADGGRSLPSTHT
jgi:hypothetical protein